MDSSRADGWIRSYLSWQARAFPTSSISGWSVLAFLFLPACLVPLLPDSDLAVPIFGTLWLMFASGATGVFLLDVSRTTASPELLSRVTRYAARAVIVLLGVAGVLAGASILVTPIQLHAVPPRLVIESLFIGGAVIYCGLSLAYRAVRPIAR